MATAKEVIDFASTQVGVTELPPNSNNVKYNTWFYGKPVSGSAYPWCSSFVSWCFSQLGAINLIKKTASCMDMAQWFKDRGQWYTKPQVGDLVFFKFGTNNRWTNHIGIVAEVKTDGSIVSFEGNTSTSSNDNGGSVMKRTRKSNIVGYGRPKYDNASSMVYPVLHKGSRGEYVKVLQQRLNYQGDKIGKPAHLVEDGIFGNLTMISLVEFQGEHNLNTTGVVDSKTWECLLQG